MTTRYTRKHLKHHFAKKGTSLQNRLKTCRFKQYQSVYGASDNKSARSNRLMFY